ncbi:MAG TPA: hypothetical protein VN371_10890 [Chlorobaculum sp.]|nr:hypothetical protein [Chlorobaculum sp.]
MMIAVPVVLSGCGNTSAFQLQKVPIDKISMWDLDLYYSYVKTPGLYNATSDTKAASSDLHGKTSDKSNTGQSTSDFRGEYFWDAYDNAINDNEKQNIRNKIMYELMTIIDDNYYTGEERIRHNMVLKNALTDVISQAISVTGSVISNGQTSRILNGIQGGFTASSSAFDRYELGGHLIDVMIKEMRACRDKVAVNIYLCMDKNVDEYPLVEGLHDLSEYYRQGSLTSALSAIAEDASKKATAADNSKTKNKLILQRVLPSTGELRIQ